MHALFGWGPHYPHNIRFLALSYDVSHLGSTIIEMLPTMYGYKKFVIVDMEDLPVDLDEPWFVVHCESGVRDHANTRKTTTIASLQDRERAQTVPRFETCVDRASRVFGAETVPGLAIALVDDAFIDHAVDDQIHVFEQTATSPKTYRCM